MDSEEETLDDLQFDGSSDEADIDEDILGALEDTLKAEASDAAEDSDTEGSDNDSDDDEDDDDERVQRALPMSTDPSQGFSSELYSPTVRSPVPRQRSLSPAGIRKTRLLSNLKWPRSFTVEAICAIPHPAPTHCLASSLCLTHLLTGSDDGYIRDYDIFTGVNGKVFLTAPQRHHCGVMEGLMKAASIRCWWENPAQINPMASPMEETPLCAPYSLAMHSDALWSLAGTEDGHINLFTLRHEPGRLCFVFPGHRGPVSGLSIQHDEKGFFSAGWNGEAMQWDLNTGQHVRTFTSHGAQLTSIGVRPLESDYTGVIPWIDQRKHTAIVPPSSGNRLKQEDTGDFSTQPIDRSRVQPPHQDDGEKSDYDPLFDEDPDADGDMNMQLIAQLPPHMQPNGLVAAPPVPLNPPPIEPRSLAHSSVAAPANAPPLLDPVTYCSFSPDILMTAAIDGQVMLWDRRIHSPGQGVGRLPMAEKTRPWCVSACWSADGSQIYVGRRNAIIDVWDVRLTGQAHKGTPRTLKTLRNPALSGDVSCVVAFPDGRHLACASNDNIRLWNVAEAGEPDAFGKMKSGVQFKIIPGHHGGIISQMLVDRQARFLISASSNRGWHGESTKTVFVHEVKNIW
ncbi:hypothetical protein PHLGIDRAFT_29015 [Phlebiopsis gigantea 11061_1 CR5-6]|uniref:Transcription factor spt8 beta-propeller domain-containing protein n=1 Tax=Phlebiopsis gigantea (strain 11061_1 CR5-6) TaxID=745531 RepID=A0A0C3S2J6_PHLG1|nr:hypothetical protein PHLGIDRAFT_29015 [Phlebiopsis gigantea 11061_1 CR5-6]